MKVLLILSVLVGVVFAAEFTAQQLSAWRDYKAQFNKEYKTSEEDMTRLRIYLDTDDRITKHNARYAQGLESFTMGHNQFSDLRSSEVPRGFNG